MRNTQRCDRALIRGHACKVWGALVRRALNVAEGLYREALAGLQATLGAGHSTTQRCAADLKALLRDKAAAARAAVRR